jgi:hypothetical protein
MHMRTEPVSNPVAPMPANAGVIIESAINHVRRLRRQLRNKESLSPDLLDRVLSDYIAALGLLKDVATTLNSATTK